ncbi:MAG: MFS transporter [Aliiglaciecola sp.]|uniref:MFS transporter n=1 Tax=Aliiglaciecola sp. TaxID=1872441 RepID=UPI003297AD93
MNKLPVTTVALIVVCLGSFIGPLGMASVNVAIPNLAADLHANAKMVSWLPTLFLLSSVVFMLPFGKLADNYGRKRIYTIGLALNAFTSLMCALGQQVEWVLFWRFVQGAASAMIFGTGVAILTSVTPSHKRGAALGLAAACVYIGLTLAPAIGGLLTEMWSWRAVFLFQLPLIVILLGLIKWGLHGEWKNEHIASFDWRGSFIFAVSSTSLVFGFSSLPKLHGFLLLIFSVLTMILFVYHQSQHHTPLIRVQMFRESRVFSMSLITSLLMYGSNFPLAFLLSLYLQVVQGYSPAEAGQILLLQAFAMAFLAPMSGRLSDKVQPRFLATFGCAIVACGFLVLSQMTTATGTTYIGGSLLLIGIGFGLFSSPNNNAIMGAVQESELGVASATLNLARTVGNLVGMSTVNLLVHYYLGDSKINAEQIPALMSTISFAFYISLISVIVATFLSGFRGKANQQSK